jgi:hypothetical protein
VRLARDGGIQVSGSIERAATGAKEALSTMEVIGRDDTWRARP